ncbi:MAG: NAD(P)-dependent oxidoreductase [Nitrospira sp.]|nr:NAD(P)-dependent oxidoreductase [Nitrospira sp.]
MVFKTIVVTGASGFIGSWVMETLARECPNSSIIGVGRRAGPSLWIDGPNCEYVSGDLLNPAIVRDRLPAKIDGLIHLAGDARTFVEPRDCTSQTEANVLLTARMADYAREAGAELFLLASSVYVYSGVVTCPFHEEAMAVPAENLGATKLAGEALVKARALAGCFHALAYRIFTVYGPRSRPTQFIPEAIRKLQSGEGAARFGAPEVKRDFVYVEDVAAAVVAGLTFRNTGQSWAALNVGSGRGTSIRELVFLLADLLGVTKRIEFSSEERTKNEANRNHEADVRRIKSVLGWQPTIPLKEGLRRTIESLKAPAHISLARG